MYIKILAQIIILSLLLPFGQLQNDIVQVNTSLYKGSETVTIIPLTGNKSVQYIEDNWNRYIILKSGQDIKIISRSGASFPEVDPAKTRIAYIYPYFWETIGDVFIYDVSKDQYLVIIKGNELKNQHTPKKIKWLNDRYLLTIIGLAYGTVSKGGSLYIYDTMNNQLHFAVEPESMTEFVDITSVDDKKVVLETHRWTDEMMNEYTEEETIFTPNDILKKAGLK